MAKFQSYPKAPYTDSTNFLARDPSGNAEVVRVEGQDILDAAVNEIIENGDLVKDVDTVTDLIATNFTSGTYVVVGGDVALFDGGQAIYRVSDPGSNGVAMDNGNEAVLLINQGVFQLANMSNFNGYIGLVDNQQVSLLGRYPDSDVGGGVFYWDGSQLKTGHNGGTIISPTVPWNSDVSVYNSGVGETDPIGVGCWIRRLDDSGEWIESTMFGIPNDGTVQKTAIDSIHDYALANSKNIRFESGIFDVGNSNWPFKNPEAPPTSFRDYGSMIVEGAGKGKTIFRTTSNDGADVLNLNGVSNISFRELSVTAVLTDTIGAGSNGVSIINGGENIDIDIEAFDCPGIDQGSFLDGGKAFTLQSGAAAVLPYKNIKIRGVARDCGYAMGFDLPYELFDADNAAAIQDVEVDIIGEDCWRGVALSGAAATALLPEDDRDANLKITGTLINCAQSLIVSRWVRPYINVHVVTNKTIANLFKPFAADQTVYGGFIVNDFKGQISVTGRMLECDNKLSIGGAVQGGGNSGASVQTNLNFELECPAVVGDEVVVINSGGNTINNSSIELKGITDGTGTDLIQDTNSVLFNAQANIGNLNSRDLTVPRDGQVYDTFKAEADGTVSLLRGGSGSAGVVDGFVFIRDTASGITYKIQLYT